MATKKNQTEQEFFAVVATGRKGLQDMADKMGGEIMEIAASNVRAAGDTWMKRAIVSIANNDQLAEVTKSRTGIFSIYKALAKAATMGLQIGGQFSHGYLTPYQGKAELIVSAEGYRHAAVHGPGAVLSDVIIRRVYEGEDFSINFASGEVVHTWDGSAELGKLRGVYGIMTRRDGVKIVDYMNKDEALKIRDRHSIAYKNGKGPWKSDEDAMVEKTAAKKFLRRFAAEAEGLAMLYGGDYDEADAYEPPPRDVSDRMADRLDKATASAAPPAEPIEVEAEEASVADVEETPAQAPDPQPAEGDLF